MPTVSAAVMSHPARRAEARRVLAGLTPLAARLVEDPEPAGEPGTLRTARLAYAAASPDATHHLVVQDDVWLPPDFATSLHCALSAQPAAAVCLFVEWGSRTAALVRLATLTGASWVPVVNPYLPTQGLALPAAVCRDFVRFLQTQAHEPEADDEAALRFLRRAGVPMLVCVPNLVEHLDGASLVGNAEHGLRRAACLVADQPVTFGRTVLDLPPWLPFLTWAEGRSVTLTFEAGKIAGRRPTAVALAERGWDRPALAAAFQPAVAQLAGLEIGTEHLFEVWLTGLATGILLRERWPAAVPDLPQRLAAGSAADRAWVSMAPGGLRNVADLDRVQARAEQLRALAITGLHHGVATTLAR